MFIKNKFKINIFDFFCILLKNITKKKLNFMQLKILNNILYSSLKFILNYFNLNYYFLFFWKIYYLFIIYI